MIANKIVDPPGFRPGIDWKPNSLPQVRFLQTLVFEVLYGGGKGSGKTEVLVNGALRWIDNPLYNALILRDSFPSLSGADGPIERSKRTYKTYGATYNKNDHVWTFPSGAKIWFGFLERDNDLDRYQGWQVQMLGFDQLEQHDRDRYLASLSLCRTTSTSGLKPIVRNTANPGLKGDWVKKRFVDTDITSKPAHFASINGEDTQVDKSHPLARSRLYIHALPTDNPNLDPEYLKTLYMLDPIRQRWYLQGDWNAEYKDGIYPNWSADNITYEADYLPGYPVYWFTDDGYTDPRVILLAQQRPCKGKPDRLCIFAEYEQSGKLAAESISDVKSWGYAHPDVNYYDAAAAEYAANAQAQDIYTIAAEKDVSRGIQIVRRLICDHNGERLILVHPRCKRTIAAIPGYRYSETKKLPNGEPAPEHDMQSHINDALRYGAISLYYYIETS